MLCFFASAQAIFAQWQWLPNVPANPRDDGHAAVANGNIYTGTGRDSGFQLLADWWQFTPHTGGTGAWRKMNDVPFSARQYAMVAANASTIYVFGGLDHQNIWQKDFWQYNSSNDSWQQLPNFLGSGRAAGVLFFLNGFVYAGLGWNGDTSFNDFYKFDIAENSWKKLPDFPSQGLHWVAYCSAGNQGFVGWGRNESYNNPNQWWRFNALTETWHEMPAPQNTTQERGTAAGTPNYVFAGFGSEAAQNAKNTVFQFSENSWANFGQPNLPARRGNNLVVLQNQLHSLWGLDENLQRTASHFVLPMPNPDEAYSIFPNPVVGLSTLIYDATETQCRVVNSLGQVVYAAHLDASGVATLHTNFWAVGVYTLVFESGKTLRFLVL